MKLIRNSQQIQAQFKKSSALFICEVSYTNGDLNLSVFSNENYGNLKQVLD